MRLKNKRDIKEGTVVNYMGQKRIFIIYLFLQNQVKIMNNLGMGMGQKLRKHKYIMYMHIYIFIYKQT